MVVFITAIGPVYELIRENGNATCNYPEGHPDCNGRSTLFDGVPWKQAEGVRDMCVFEAPETPCVYVAELEKTQVFMLTENHMN